MADRTKMQEFFKGGCWAVVGASRDPFKYGSVVHQRLRSRGEKVYPVNPSAEEIDGERCYPRLGDLPEGAEQVVVVVPPERTEKVVEEADQAGIKKVWMQPGAESEAAVKYCEEHGIDVISKQCILQYMDQMDL